MTNIITCKLKFMREKIKYKTKSFLQTYPKLSMLLAGSLCALAFAPFYFFVSLFISLPIFYFIINQTHGKKVTFLHGFCFGYGYFLAGIYWIAISLLVDAQQFAWLIPFALTIIPGFLALYFGFLAITFKFLVKKFSFKFDYQKILLLAMLWVFFEMLRSTLFSGFAWNLIGQVWLFSIYPAQLAQFFGIYFLSFLAILTSLLPISLNKIRQNFSNKIFSFLVIAIFFGNFVFGFFTIKNLSPNILNPQKIRLVQANIKQDMKWQESERYDNLLRHIELTRSMPFDDIKAVVWAETSVPYVINNDVNLLNLLKLSVPQNGELITGGLRIERENNNQITKIFNSIFLINSQGISASYDKHHLVPFGEYVPLQKFFSFLFIDDVVNKITGGGEGFSAGQGAQIFQTTNFTFNPLICYEVIFSNEIIEKNQYPDMFINITNDAWFGNSTGPYQHLASAQMRSIEYATPLIRVAGTGISALIDANGRIIKKIDLNQEGVIDVEILKRNKISFYHRYGNISLMMIFLTLMLICKFIAKPKTQQ